MPPPKSNLSLSKDEIELLRAWIEQGAEWQKHWAFLPVEAVQAPQVANPHWPRNEIDRFVLARLEGQGLRPAPEAGKERWLRRVTFDLTGLPPTLAEINAFLADQSSQAHDRVVDGLLASPSFGGWMAGPPLDIASMLHTPDGKPRCAIRVLV